MSKKQNVLNQQALNTKIQNDFEEFVPHNTKATLKRLWQSASEQHGRLFVVLACVIVYTILSLVAPYYSSIIVDLLWENIQASNSLGEAFSVTWRQGGFEIFVLFMMYVATWAVYSVQSYLMVSFAEKLNLHFRTELGEKLNRLPLAFFDRNKTGAILSYFTNDLDKMAEAIQGGLLRLLTSVGLVTGSIVMMFRFNVAMTFVFLGFSVISMLVTRLVSGKTLRYAALRQQAMEDVTATVEEYYSGRTIIKSFNQEENSSQKMHEVNERMAQVTERADTMTSGISPAIRTVNRIGQMFIAVLAGWSLINGRLSVGAFQAFFQYVGQAAEPLTQVSYVINTMQSALASAERIYKVLDDLEVSEDPAIPKLVDHAKGHVEFKNVSFGYFPDRILMKKISFEAKPGQKIAIVGATGAGKTTLINLLMRFYDVNGGQILLDGVDTAEMTRKNLRSNFGMVLQDTWLFEGTIAENIAYGKPDATKEEIIAAAKAARVDFFVRTMPKGYDTVLTNDAENISIGQRQLLTIARVVLCDPAVLILDEATSSVDTRTEIEINKAMNALMENRTSFVIAHRLSTIVDADLILVMANGDIIEQGSHEELLQRGGAYAELYNSQFAAS